VPKITVLGAGRIGATIALDLAQGGEFQVAVVDVSEPALARLGARGMAVRCQDLGQADQVRAAVADADLVVGAVPGSMGFRTLEAVLEAGKDVVDISFFEEDPFRLDALARERGLTALVDCGVAPGCDNLILGDLERDLERVTRFECLVGGLPLVRTLPFEYKAGFSPVDVLEEYTRPARYLAHGQVVVAPALSELELIDFPGVGTLEAFNTDGLRTLLHTVAAPFMKEKTLRYPGHAEKMRLLWEAGFLGRSPVRAGDAWVVPAEVTASLLFPLWRMEEGDEDFTLMRVVVEGMKDDSPVRRQFDLLDRYDRATGTTSMARTTGHACAAAVRLVASGRYRRKGISPPEYLGREAGCWPFIRTELARRGVVFTEA
jgi:saccharopine dehydrogenase-like NADP-dependent oxidoreductase